MARAEFDALAEGRYDPDTSRVTPGRLLRNAVSLPVLRGVEPYTDLLRDLRHIVVHPKAVAEFGYDWRLLIV